MQSKWLLLNANKTDVAGSTNYQLPVWLSTPVRDLGILLDADLSVRWHVHLTE
jgi:hypothetical protein